MQWLVRGSLIPNVLNELVRKLPATSMKATNDARGNAGLHSTPVSYDTQKSEKRSLEVSAQLVPSVKAIRAHLISLISSTIDQGSARLISKARLIPFTTPGSPMIGTTSIQYVASATWPNGTSFLWWDREAPLGHRFTNCACKNNRCYLIRAFTMPASISRSASLAWSWGKPRSAIRRSRFLVLIARPLSLSDRSTSDRF